MPIGCSSLVPHVVDLLEQRRPKSILDLGVGFGLYGAAVRQWLDFGVRPWRSWLVGVEGWAGYRSPCWDLYDEVHVAEMRTWLVTHTERFNAILVMDVLEHFDENTGRDLIRLALDRLAPRGILIVGTPAVWIEQGAVYGNELERHRSLWTAAHLQRLGFTVHVDGTVNQFGHRMLLASTSPYTGRR